MIIKKIVILLISYILLLNVLIAKTVITTDGNIDLDQDIKIITLNNNVLIHNIDNNFKVVGNKAIILYNSLDKLKDNISKEDYSNFKKITIEGNLSITTETSIITGDEYIYDVAKKIMVIRSYNKNSTYKDANIKAEVKDRFEYQEEANIVVLRGSPTIEFINDKSNNKQIFKANIIYGKLNEEKTDISYVEAFDNIEVILADSSKITGKYAYYSNKDDLLTIEDNVTISHNGSKSEVCKIIVNTKTEQSKIIPCGKNSITGTINIKN